MMPSLKESEEEKGGLRIRKRKFGASSNKAICKDGDRQAKIIHDDKRFWVKDLSKVNSFGNWDKENTHWRLKSVRRFWKSYNQKRGRKSVKEHQLVILNFERTLHIIWVLCNQKTIKEVSNRSSFLACPQSNHHIQLSTAKKWYPVWRKKSKLNENKFKRQNVIYKTRKERKPICSCFIRQMRHTWSEQIWRRERSQEKETESKKT